MGEQVVRIPAGLVDAGANDRQFFDPVKLRDLAENIAEHGLAQPPVLRPKGNGRFEIVAGERRTRAMRDVLGWSEIPALVREMSDEQAAAIMLAENVQREDLRPLEEARAYQNRMERFGWSIAETARKAQVSESKVRNRLALLSLVPEAQKLVDEGQLGVGYGEAMAGLDVNRQRLALQWLAEQKGLPSLRVFGQVVGKLQAEQEQEALFDLSLFTLERVEAAVEQAEGRLKGVLPKLPELPELPNRVGTWGQVVDEYASRLLDDGFAREARVIVDFWVKCMELNGFRLSPYDSELLRRHGDKLVKERTVVYA